MKKRKHEESTEGSSRIEEEFRNIESEQWIPNESNLDTIISLLEDAKDDLKALEMMKTIDLKVLTNLLVAYRATCCNIDTKIFAVLMTLEKYGVDLNPLQPMVFGANARRNYENLRKMGMNLHVRITPDEAVKTYLDAATLWNTLKYHVKPVTDENAEKIYNVRYILPFFYSILQPASQLSCKLFIEHNCLSLIFSCTSSSNYDIRVLAYACLQRFANLLQELKMEVFAEKGLFVYLIRLFKHGFETPIPRLSSVISHFFARVCKLILNPSCKVYPQIMAFLCMKPIFDISNVPEFYKLLFSSSPEHHNEEREWILTLISEALLEPMDYQTLQNRAGIKLLLSTFSSNWIDRKARSLILRALQNAVQMPSVAHDLFVGEALHVWIASVIAASRYSRWERNFLAQIFVALLENERKYQRSQKGKETICKTAMATARICSRKVIQVLRKIEKDNTFVPEQEKAGESISRIEHVIDRKWKMKKKYVKT